MNKKIIFLVTEDWYFLSHRLPIALACQKEGYEVFIACKDTGQFNKIKEYGFKCFNLKVQRGNISLFSILKNILEIRKIIKASEASFLHAVSIQSIILGLLATIFNQNIKFIVAVTGLGSLFLARNLKARLIKLFINFFLIICFQKKNIRVIVQNKDDKYFVNKILLCPLYKISLIRGSGIDINYHKAQPEPIFPPIVISYVGRIIQDKGIENLIKAFRLVHKVNKNVKLLLVGSVDKNNIRPISEKFITENNLNHNIEFVGEVEDIREIWKMSHIAILLSKREGLPKSLLEAAAAGRAIISSDVPGSREIAIQSINAELVKLEDTNAIVKAILYLSENNEVRKSYGIKSRKLLESDMSEDEVIKNTLSLYQDFK